MRLSLTNKKDIEKLNRCLINGLALPLSDLEKQSLYKVFDLYDQNEEKLNIVKNAFYEKFDSYPILKKIHDWWDTIPYSISLTSIGRVLGHANAQSCNSNFPALD